MVWLVFRQLVYSLLAQLSLILAFVLVLIEFHQLEQMVLVLQMMMMLEEVGEAEAAVVEEVEVVEEELMDQV